MSANYFFGQDILQDALFRAGERQDLAGGSASDYLAAAKRYIMRGYYDTITDYPFPKALSSPPGIINTLDKVTGTATFTKGSASVTLGATVADSLTGRKFYIDNEGVLYRVSAHTGGTDTLTLDATYKEESGTGSFVVYQDEYDLASDCLTIRYANDRANPSGPIEIVSEQLDQDLRSYGIGREGWIVEELSIVEGGKARLRPWLTEARTIEYVYVKRPPTLSWDATSNDIPTFIDEEHRHVLADYAAAFVLKDKKDAEWESTLSFYKAELDKMKGKHVLAQKLRQYPKPGGGIWR